jgi:hypothetical protein
VRKNYTKTIGTSPCPQCYFLADPWVHLCGGGALAFEHAGIALFLEHLGQQCCRREAFVHGFWCGILASSHQSFREESKFGDRHVICSLESVSCHTWLEKGKVMSRSHIVYGSLSQRTHRGWCCRWRRCSLSTIKHRFFMAYQRNNFTRRGAQVFQINFQELKAFDPWNVAR